MDPKVSSMDVARLLGITTRQVSRLVSENVLTRDARGVFDATAVVQAYIRHREHAAGRGMVGDARHRFEIARARKAELEAGRMAGEQVAVSIVETAWALTARTVRDALLALPHRAAARIGQCRSSGEIQVLLSAQVNEILFALATVPVAVEKEEVGHDQARH